MTCAHSDYLGGTVCTPQCNLKKDFSRIPANMYICQSTGEWYVWDYRPSVSQELPWPDCTGGYPFFYLKKTKIPVAIKRRNQCYKANTALIKPSQDLIPMSSPIILFLGVL